MVPSAEALVGIVSLVVALPPSALILWHCFRRPRRFTVDLENPILIDDTETAPQVRRPGLRSNSYEMAFITRSETLLLLSGGVAGQ
ncbi:hypothetical protein GTA08_BOTSDO03420 [Botryosphaeria dothidea]|uniref:Uncharacterized protein n=1 Tax=Botryosphaeria dothidea TaxID=55169 RepID=A0A8H4N9T9_9PEZI|nr:hypothetical protein GTA08_BOTSDO03420 [Botryosphaeria dothidea]